MAALAYSAGYFIPITIIYVPLTKLFFSAGTHVDISKLHDICSHWKQRLWSHLNAETSCSSYIYQRVNETYVRLLQLARNMIDFVKFIRSRSSCAFVHATIYICGVTQEKKKMNGSDMEFIFANEKGWQFRLPSNIQIQSIIPTWSPFLSQRNINWK